MSAPVMQIPVGVVVARSRGTSEWVDYLWRPVAVLAGVPETAPWTKLSDDGEYATFFAGTAVVALYRSDSGGYRDNLASGTPSLWVVLRPTEVEPPYELFLVTADPSEGEGMTAAGNDIVESVPMPGPVRDTVEAFVAEHHVEQVFEKRKRDRADPDALARHAPGHREDRR